VSADVLLAQVAGLEGEAAGPPVDTEAAIKADPRLTATQKSALLSVYRSMIGESDVGEPPAEQPASPEAGREKNRGRRRAAKPVDTGS
jgi:hypothetical protein